MVKKEFELPIKGVNQKAWSFKVIFKENGWEILNPPNVGGECDKFGYAPDGTDVLEFCFNQDGVVYPSNINLMFGELWDNIDSGYYSTSTAIQDKFNELADLIIQLNKDLPKDLL